MGRRSPQSALVEHLFRALSVYRDIKRLWVAYSGGRDSHVLLSLLAAIRARLEPVELHIVHVNHGLSPNAAKWAQHCAMVCQALKLPYQALNVDATPMVGESQEAAARNARYQALEQLLVAGDALCTAHHQEDQAETLLLQLMRGAGPKGLAAMPESAPLGEALLLRPLLGVSRDTLCSYAQTQGLEWIDDESNFDTRFDRNYLRREVMPRLKKRWPAVAQTVSRSAAHCAKASHTLQSVAKVDFDRVQGESRERLNITALLTLDSGRRSNLLRYWIQMLGLPLPTTQKLHQVESELLPVAVDQNPCVSWSGGEIRRYAGELYAMPPQIAFDGSVVMEWDLESPLRLPDGRELNVTTSVNSEFRQNAIAMQWRGSDAITVRFRQGGERCRLPGAPHQRRLKQLLQEWGVPPWLRRAIPLLYVEDALLAVVGYCLCDGFIAPKEKVGIVVSLDEIKG